MVEISLDAIRNANAEVAARKIARQTMQVEFRKAEAQEIIADEITMLRAEVSVIRNLIAVYAARLVTPAR